MLGAVEDVDAVARVHGHVDDVAVAPAGRDLLPALGQLVGEVALADDYQSVNAPSARPLPDLPRLAFAISLTNS